MLGTGLQDCDEDVALAVAVLGSTSFPARTLLGALLLRVAWQQQVLDAETSSGHAGVIRLW